MWSDRGAELWGSLHLQLNAWSLEALANWYQERCVCLLYGYVILLTGTDR